VQEVSLILLAAGNSSRLNLPTKKQWLYIEDRPLWQFVAQSFEKIYDFKEIIVVGNQKELELMSSFADYIFVAGSQISRQESLANALKATTAEYVMVSDVARACIDANTILELIDKKEPKSCIVPAIRVSDTTYYDGKPIDREKLLRVQTPQLSHKDSLIEILQNSQSFSDESSAFYAANKRVIFVDGSSQATKITYKSDLAMLSCLKPPLNLPKVGYGIDTHPFEENKPMVLNGVEIESSFGFKAHSDGDVAIHSLIDALLGASGLGDIGELFPDTDSKYKNANSKELLKEVVALVKGVGYEIVNIDMTIVAQTPKISPYKKRMKEVLSNILNIELNRVNIKATTSEKLGFIGRKEGVTVHTVATINYYNWRVK
jgi:2-C-methyl-D-erythritol 4-phosphate cytidylyltransferase/2-C-methyl-D-erythritol 2,4-cyclodiphosphate synthase